MRRYKNRNRRSFIKKEKVVSGSEIFTRRLLATDILGALEENGFSRCERLETKFGDNSEIVYAKPIELGSRKIIAVYTSCNQVGGAFIARASGKDAIRIAGLYVNKEGKTKGIVKNTRVNRVGLNEAIVKRLMERILKTNKLLNSAACCGECGAPSFLSKNNNLVCAELCWSKK